MVTNIFYPVTCIMSKDDFMFFRYTLKIKHKIIDILFIFLKIRFSFRFLIMVLIITNWLENLYLIR